MIYIKNKVRIEYFLRYEFEKLYQYTDFNPSIYFLDWNNNKGNTFKLSNFDERKRKNFTNSFEKNTNIKECINKKDKKKEKVFWKNAVSTKFHHFTLYYFWYK